MKRKPSKNQAIALRRRGKKTDNGTKMFVHGGLLIKLFFYPFGSSSDEHLSWYFSSCQRSRRISDGDEDVWGHSLNATAVEMITDDLKLHAGKYGKQLICGDGLAAAAWPCTGEDKERYCGVYCNGVYGNVHCTSLALTGNAGSHSPTYQSHDFSRQKQIKRLLTLSRGGREERVWCQQKTCLNVNRNSVSGWASPPTTSSCNG